jgi:hypothetical protein
MSSTQQLGSNVFLTGVEKQRLFDQVLGERLDAEMQVLQEIARSEAERSGLYEILKHEIDAFLDCFLEENSWKRLFVTSELDFLRRHFETSSDDDRRIKIMEFSAQMSQLVRSCFDENSVEYREAMVGVGRITELLLSWRSDERVTSIRKFEGIKVDGDPVKFLRRHYSKWIASGRLTQVSLRDADEKLLNAIKYELRKSGRPLAEVVPPGIRR